MSQNIKLRRGFNINLVGKAEKKIGTVNPPEKYAIKPTDFHGFKRPKILVEVGQKVKAGEPLVYDRLHERIKHVAPVSGEVVDIVRGKKRVLLEIVIQSDNQFSSVEFKKFSPSDLVNLDRESVVNIMTESGLWPNIIQRPFGVIANPADEPKSIFVSGFDTHPLAPDYGFLLDGRQQDLQAGITILKKLTPGKIHWNVQGDGEMPSVYSSLDNVEINKFSGPHPSGNVGVQIHHIDPINKGDLVWTVNPYGVAQIGRLFLGGVYDSSKVVALVGSEVAQPQYYKTHMGACIDTLVENNLTSDHVRFISGNALTGNRIDRKGYIGYYDNMITVLPEGDYEEMLGWILPTTKKLSFHRAFGLLSFLNPGKEYKIDTNMHGEPRAFVETGIFERVTPMDIYPMYLIKAILAEDFDDMESLGILEVIEEDLALCEFVDVSKHDIQAIIREGIELIQTS